MKPWRIIVAQVAGSACLLYATPGLGWGNRATHERLTDIAVARANQDGSFDRYLREQLGLENGEKQALAIQTGFDESIDGDLVDSMDETTRIAERSRLNKSYNRIDWGDNGFESYPPAPGDALVDVNLGCDPLATDFDACVARLRRVPILQLLRSGTWAEDNPNPRAQHHFHDPERDHAPPTGNHGLDNLKRYLLGIDAALIELGTTAGRGGRFLRGLSGLLLSPILPFTDLDVGNFDYRGRSAMDRALDTSRSGSFPSDQNPKNFFALPDAERYLYRALTAPRKDEREHYLALHFLAFGHVLHLLQDMGSVAHTRNDFVNDHLRHLFDNLEHAGEDPAALRSVIAQLGLEASVPFASFPRSFLGEHSFDPSPYAATIPALDPSGLDIADFWDQGEPGQLTGRGLAEVVHNQFLSTGSTSNSAFFNGYALPMVPSCGTLGDSLGSGEHQVRVANLPERILATGDRNGSSAERFLTHPLVPHLARCAYHCQERRPGYPDRGGRHWCATVVDDSVQRDYLELLFPLVIDYTTRFTELYFQPRVEVVPEGNGTFKLANLTQLPFTADAGAVELAYEGDDTLHHTVAVGCSGNLALPPAPMTGERGPLSSATCALPPASELPVPPAFADSFTVVVRGQHGGRGSSDPPGDWEDGDFVTAFVRHKSTLVYDSSRGHGTPPATDVPEKTDIYQQEIDPRFPPESETGEINLTGFFRGVLDRPDIDFMRAVREGSGGRRIAFRSDVFTSPLPGSNPREIQANTEALIFDPYAEPTLAALVRIPGSEINMAETLRRDWELAWSRDGAALFFRRGLSFNSLDLARLTVANETLDVFREPIAEVSTFPREDFVNRGIGTELETCSDAEQIEALTATRLLVVADCVREEVVLETSGQKALQFKDLGDSLLYMDVASVSGQLEGTYTHRFAVNESTGTGSIVACSGASCSVHASASFFSPSVDSTSQRVAFLFRPDDSVLLETAKQLLVTEAGGTIRPLVVLDADGPRSIADPAWSPDGKWLAFLIIDTSNGSRDLYVVPTNEPGLQEPVRVTRDADVSGSVLWGHNGLVLPVQ